MSSTETILVLNGPNLSRLDLRERTHYGELNYPQLHKLVEDVAQELGLKVDIRQSDDEATLIGWLHEAADHSHPVIFNPAAFTHYSVAIRDAAALLRAPLIEVHLSNPLAREEFRHTSMIAGVATGTIGGFKEDSYRLALIAMKGLIEANQ
ncbi:MAG: type II 3-dehydroquinate dehydratase [Actinomycetota bacterium]